MLSMMLITPLHAVMSPSFTLATLLNNRGSTLTSITSPCRASTDPFVKSSTNVNPGRIWYKSTSRNSLTLCTSAKYSVIDGLSANAALLGASTVNGPAHKKISSNFACSIKLTNIDISTIFLASSKTFGSQSAPSFSDSSYPFPLPLPPFPFPS